MTSDRLILTSVAVAFSLALAGACYDLTPVPPNGGGGAGGSSCVADMTTPDACPPAEVPDGGDNDADIDGGVEASDNGESDLDSSVDGESVEEASP
jgi:hypothetical protein